jgi:hypothetical protein
MSHFDESTLRTEKSQMENHEGDSAMTRSTPVARQSPRRPLQRVPHGKNAKCGPGRGWTGD